MFEGYEFGITTETDPDDESRTVTVCTLKGPKVSSRRVFLAPPSDSYSSRPQHHAERIVESLDRAYQAGRDSMAYDLRTLVGLKS